FSPDCRLLTSLAGGNEGGGPLIIWDLQTGKQRYREMNEHWTTACFSPDGNHLAVSGHLKELKVIDAASGKLVRQFPIFWTTALAFSPDGKILAAGHMGGISFWDIETGKRLPGSSNPLFDVRRMRFADGGKRLVGLADELIVWDPANGKEIRRFPKVPRA